MKNIVLGFCFLFLCFTAECLDKIGTVVALEGGLKAVDSSSNERLLSQNSEIYLGDTLVTDEIAKGEIQFLDGTLVLLIPSSQYTMASYSSNRYKARLVSGGVRISTGLIAKKNPENFELNTPNATIGVRGTVFETRIADGNVYVGSSSGNLAVNNSAGKIDIGSNNQNSFASISSNNTAPQPLSERPPALDLSHFEVPPGGLAFSAGTAQMPAGAGAVAGSSLSTGFAWAPALGGLAIIGAVVSAVVSASTQTTPNYSHTEVSSAH